MNRGDVLSTNDMFQLTDLYFMQKNIMFSHLHNSFDKFIDDHVRILLQKNDNVFFQKVTTDKIYRYRFEFENISIRPPTVDDELMTPYIAQTRNLTYSGKIVGTIKQYQDTIDIASDKITTKLIGTPEHNYPIAVIPIMILSSYCSLNIKPELMEKECEYDEGGYFIVNGSEKVIMSQERICDNKPLVFTKKDSNSLIYSVQVNSRSNNNDMIQIVTIRMKKDNLMNILVPILKEIPVFILFRALGVESDRDIINMIVYKHGGDADMENYIELSLNESKVEGTDVKIMTQEDAISYLINKMRVIRNYSSTDPEMEKKEKKMHLLSLLTNSFLPHVEPDLLKKAYYLGLMINKLLLCKLGKISKDDRDSYVNKRVDLPGDLLFELFKQYYKKMINDCTKYFKNRNTDDINPLNIINQIKAGTIEQGLKTALSTGVWGKRTGVAQMMPRLTYIQTRSALRRINSPTVDASTNKLTSPRHLHASQVGFVCVTGDTQIKMGDGSIKLIKNMKNGDCVLTVNKDTLEFEPSIIKNYFSTEPDELLKITTINGKVIKCTPDHPFLVHDVRKDEVDVPITSKAYSWVQAKDLQNIMSEGKNMVMNEKEYFAPHCNFVVYESAIFNDIKKENDDVVAMLDTILSIEPIKPETVYDFETINDNHSFIANGFVTHNCVVETPEGHKVGLVKNLSMMGNITIMLHDQIEVIKSKLKGKLIDLYDIKEGDLDRYTRVFLNGEWLGLSKKPNKLFMELKEMKYNNEIDPTVSINHEVKSDVEHKELKIYCDGGRLYRPLIRVENNTALLTKKQIDMIELNDLSTQTNITKWNEFMLKNPRVLEYVDVDESSNSLIAENLQTVIDMKNTELASIEMIKKDKNINLNHLLVNNRYDEMLFCKYTHCEIHPSMILGVVASNIPFLNHNMAPRNMYQFSQARQALGYYATNYRDRMDISYILYHSQKPLISTRTAKYTNTDVLPAGENVILAIACYSG